MNPQTSQQTAKGRPVDWIAWSLWSILFVVVVVSGFLTYRKNLAQTGVWLPAKDLPAYHFIIDSDIAKTTRSISDLPVDAISSNISPVGGFTIRSVSSGHVLLRGDIVLPANLQLTTNTVALSIPATAAMTLNGRLASGDVISLWEVSYDGTTSIAKLILDQVLVLDVSAVTPAPIDNSEVFPYVVILAVPVDRQSDILSSAAKGLLVFTLRP